MNQWQNNNNDYWQARIFPTTDMEAGVYSINHDNRRGIYFTKEITPADNIISLPDAPSKRVLDEILQFWSLESEFVKRGLIFKRGVLLYGPPGSGKTVTLRQLTEMIVNTYNGIAIRGGHPNYIIAGLKLIRQLETKRPIVILMEDFDNLIENGDESAYLALLDGEHQISNVVFVATTNYKDKLPPRITNRPSRFDCVMEIGMPNAESRKKYLKEKEPSLYGEELTEWVSASDGFSIAHLRELIILCRCYHKPLVEAVARLKAMKVEEKEDDEPVSLDAGHQLFSGGR